MPEYSYNGWLASRNKDDFGGLQLLIVGSESFAPGVRAGDVHDVLEYVAKQMNARVEPVVRGDWHQADDWGYAYRTNRNANNLSCHASGTAIDYNATRHPNGSSGTFSAAQVREIRVILAEVDGVVRWGGDFRGTKDEMHFEISANAERVRAVASKIRDGGDDLNADQAAKLDRIYHEMTHFLPNRRGDGWNGKDTTLGYSANADAFGARNEAFLRGTIYPMLQQIANKNNVDIDEAAIAQAIVAQLSPLVQDAVFEAMGEDNQDTAQQILDALKNRL